MSGTDAEGQTDAGGPGDVESRGGSADVDFGGLLREFNPFRWAIEAFRAGGLNQWEEYALDALFAAVVIVVALGIAGIV